MWNVEVFAEETKKSLCNERKKKFDVLKIQRNLLIFAFKSEHSLASNIFLYIPAVMHFNGTCVFSVSALIL